MIKQVKYNFAKNFEHLLQTQLKNRNFLNLLRIKNLIRY